MKHQSTINATFNKIKIIAFCTFILLASKKVTAQIQITEDLIRTYNYYRTWAKGEQPGTFNKLDWQVRFIFSENTIKKYREKDGFPTRKWVLNSEYDIEKSEKKEGDNGVIYLYNTKNKVQVGCNPYGKYDNLIIIDGNKYTEYFNYR